MKMVAQADRLNFFCFSLYHFLLCYIAKKAFYSFLLKYPKKFQDNDTIKTLVIFIALHYTTTDSDRSLLIQNRTSVMGTFNLSGLETNRVFFLF